MLLESVVAIMIMVQSAVRGAVLFFFQKLTNDITTAYFCSAHSKPANGVHVHVAKHVGKEGACSVCLCLSSPPFKPACIHHTHSSTGGQGGCGLCMPMLIIPTL
jgi:hypothetical protein